MTLLRKGVNVEISSRPFFGQFLELDGVGRSWF
jgi:hypothetical protein